MGLRPALGFSDLTLTDMPGAFLVSLRPADSQDYTGCLLSLLSSNLEASVYLFLLLASFSLFFVAPTFLNISQVSLQC